MVSTALGLWSSKRVMEGRIKVVPYLRTCA